MKDIMKSVNYLKSCVQSLLSHLEPKKVEAEVPPKVEEVVQTEVPSNIAQAVVKVEEVKMGLKTFRVTATVIDEETGKSDSTVYVEQEHQTNLGVCDLQDLLSDTYGVALRQKGRAFAQAKADSAAAAAGTVVNLQS